VEQLLTTKLYIPTSRLELVPRPRLIHRLNEGMHCKLTLISAPAGFGKTTLVTEWVSHLDEAHPSSTISHPSKVGWLSLDENDNDPARFLTYLITALNQIEGIGANLGKGALSMLQPPQPPSVAALLTSLINEIVTIRDKIILVLDDYQLIDAQPVHDALRFLLENLPPQMHLVIATREDPYLPLSRLRARCQLTELRAADLRFTSSEAAEFLNRVMGLNLSKEDITELESRTEGWIAGLQLAAISMQGRDDVTAFINSFTGSNRLVLDYLIEEVLNRQSDNIQNFLLKTSILDRLTGSLCDAVTGQDNGQATLEMLDHANLFILPLDDERRWYRYHYLFADLLRQEIGRKYPEQRSELHRRASEWYEQIGHWSDAIRHAFTAEDIERVADLAELAWGPMNMRYQSVTWLGWVKELPAELVCSRPALSAGCGWASLDSGDLDAAELHLRNAELGLEATVNAIQQLEVPVDKSVLLEDEELRSLSTSIANARAYLAQALGDLTGTVRYSRRATDLLGESDYFERGLADVIRGFAYWASGDLEAADKAVADAISNMQMTGRILFVISFTSYLADIMTAQGRFRETIRTYLKLLETVAEQNEPEVPEMAVLHLGLSELFLEQGDMEAARWHLRKSEAFGEQPAFAPWYRHWIYAHARVMAAEGDLHGVIEMLNGAERLYYRHPIPDVRPLKALLAQTWLAQGELTETLRWVHDRGLSVDDDLSYLREFEHITLARVLLAQYKNEREDRYIHDTMGLLARLLKAAEEGKRMGSVIKILVLQALAFEAQDKISAALKPLERALNLAELEGYVQAFAGEGPPMARLLYEVLSQGISPGYIQRLLVAFPDFEPGRPEFAGSQISGEDWIEPLSDREIEVLQLITEGLTNSEIAARLYLSLNTVKAHTRNIYGKLNVHNRTQAIARSQELGLLPRSPQY
jgi:LuxR family maltose regulon positive regulatory protein